MFFHYLIRRVLESPLPSLEVFLIDPGLDILTQLQFRNLKRTRKGFFFLGGLYFSLVLFFNFFLNFYCGLM